ncbi:MAG: hypothetical protein II008_18435 [Oscillospiraceae bacterium]|jgi:hypothetical protein|nr:hypothetical protein [Oscillospiraceae bacterium]
MGRLEPIDGKQTKWEGLWWHPEYNGFSSAVLDLSDLRKFKGRVRLYVRKNKFFNGGENGRPNYNFTLKDSDADVFHLLEVEEDEEPEEKTRSFTYDELQALINRVACDVGGESSYGEYLVTDYIDW